jgi:WhiB family redox-sensing transcriptional regulator
MRWRRGHGGSRRWGNESVSLISVGGDVDITNAGRLANDIARSCRSGDEVVFDLTEPTFLDCSGLRVLPHSAEQPADVRLAESVVHRPGCCKCSGSRCSCPSTTHRAGSGRSSFIQAAIMTIHQTLQHHSPRSPSRWAAHAACKDADPDLFFPITWDELPGRAGDEARRICQACPVRPACLDWAVQTGEPDGMWGGTTPAERRRLRARQTA